jgi:CheY-like chemotaxis protein/HPt (histidine-containing phosphotransfer) domain-containing protein
MHARTAASAKEGLAILRRAATAGEAYQIALLDVMMPAVDGIEMARQLKGDAALAQTAVIFVSSVGARAEFARRLIGLDIAGWLIKPVPQSSLYNELVRVLGDVTAPDITQLRQPEPPAGEAITLPSDLNRHVLLAEDNPINQKVAKLQLAKLGFQVHAVINGREAVDATLLRHYDLIFMDCQMPEMDGYQATRELRKRQPVGSRSRIIAMTAHALPGDREKCLAAGMDAYVSKPVTQAALEAALRQLFSRTASAPGFSDSEHPLAPVAHLPYVQVALEPKSAQPGQAATQEIAIQSIAPLSLQEQPFHAAVTENEAPPKESQAAPGDATLPTHSVPGDENTRSADSDKICDPATVGELRAEGEGLLPELVDIFQIELTKGLDELAHALDTRDCLAVARIAHTLKGTAGTFGATRMHEMAARLDQTARMGHADEAAAMFEQFRTECERVRSYLTAEAAA